MPRGGRRPGAGRPKGSRNRRVEWREKLAARLAGALAECGDLESIVVSVNGRELTATELGGTAETRTA
jgi:hypothetical protein